MLLRNKRVQPDSCQATRLLTSFTLSSSNITHIQSFLHIQHRQSYLLLKAGTVLQPNSPSLQQASIYFSSAF